MVSGKEDMSAACSEFRQNAWRKDLCVNCQRSKGEHTGGGNTDENGAVSDGDPGTSNVASSASGPTTQRHDTDSPKPAKRNSLMAKSWTAHDSHESESQENDDARWDAMCRPSVEHSYEAIDEIANSIQSSDSTVKEMARKTNSLKIGDNSMKLKDDIERVSVTLPRDSKSRSRSRSKSPVPAPKPKVLLSRGSKENISDSPPLKTKVIVTDSKMDIAKSESSLSSSPKSNKSKCVVGVGKSTGDTNKSSKVQFVTSEPEIIAEDGGYDNLIPETEEHLTETADEIKEILIFTEKEREWALLALKNTIWNSNSDNLNNDSGKLRTTQSREFEDIELESLWKPDRFANVKDFVDLPSQNVYGTYPLRTKSGKSSFDTLFDGSNLETIDETYETFLKYGFGDSKENEIGAKLDRLIANEVDLSDASYDDPWGDKFGFDVTSEMNLLDEIKGEIDLDSSSAGMALVDLLNDVLSKYSTGTPSETDSVKNMDNFYEDTDEKAIKEKKPDKKVKKEHKEIPTELEAKVVTLAASLRLKQRAKKHAPRPPSCPPAPPISPGEQEAGAEKPKTPSEQLELRAAQSKEPLFKMVPVGKPIGNSPVAQAQSSPTPRKIESDSSLESMDSNKTKEEKPKKGGITGFFRNFLRRSKGSDPDITASADTISTNASQTSLQSEHKMKLDMDTSEKSDSSPQMKLKVMPGRPVSPKPTGRPPDKPTGRSPDKSKANASDAEKIKPNATEPDKTVESDTTKSSDDNKDTTCNSVQKEGAHSETKEHNHVDNKSKSSSLNSSTKSTTSSLERDHPMPSPKSKEAPSLPSTAPRQASEAKVPSPRQLSASKEKEAPSAPTIGPRQLSDSNLQPPKPRKRGSSDGGQTRSRPRTKDMTDAGRHRDTPNVPPPKPPLEHPHVAPPRPPTEAPSVPPPKPPLAAKPKPPTHPIVASDDTDKTASKPPLHKEGITKSPPRKERVASTSSLEDESTRSRAARDPHAKVDPAVLRKRAKSPKRIHAPVAPRASLPNILSESNSSSASSISQTTEHKPLAFAKELEQKLQKEAGNVAEVKKMSGPAPPSPTAKVVPELHDTQKSTQSNSPKEVKKDPHKVHKESEKLNENDEKIHSSDKDDNDAVQEQEIEESNIAPVEHIEKIELPKAASSSRKSFLGKLNRKNRPTQPPSVKRTKSITESSVAGDLHLKKIDLKDISGPVLITEMSSNKVVNRRNTISLGDDNAFLSGGSTSSGSTSTTGDKSEMSPQGSLENMYELISAEAPPPPIAANEKQASLRPPSINSLGIEGYLEPVRSGGGVNKMAGEPVKQNTAESSTKEPITIAANMAASCHADILSVNQSSLSKQTESANKSGEVTNMDELDTLDISEERRRLLASQPIYEEITNGYGRLDQTETGAFPVDIRPILNGDPQLCHTSENSRLNVDVPHARTSSSLQSKDSFSSDSDLSSANNSLSRNPRPIPRRRPRQSVGVGFEQYVAMNRPSVAVFLNEDQLREILSKLTAMNLQTLRELYTQHEKTFSKESVHLGGAGPLKWIDFDIYGKPVHASEQSVVYNAKLKQGQSACQIMLLHSRPEMTTANHPSLLKPTCIFTDSVPYSYLTEDFIKTNQLLQTSLNQSNSAKCYIVVGLFDITESVTHHLSTLQSLCENQNNFLRKILFFTLQLLSAISHCLEQGHPLAEADFLDICLISNPYCLGEIVAFLPQSRSPENQQMDTVCYFLENFLDDMCVRCEANTVLDDDAYSYFAGIQKIISMLQSGATECLPVVRSYTEFLLWGPQDTDLQFSDDRTSNLEPKLSMWLEKQRASLIHDFAKRKQNGARCRIEDFYNMKFLLKASSGSLAECVRCHAAS